jgi:hypothetical protein
LTKKERQILDNLSQAVDFVIKYNKRKVRTKLFNQLSCGQLKELDKAIEEADNKETISWGDFKKEMKEWKKLVN